MHALLSLARAIDTINERIGKLVAWLVLAAVLISAGNAIVRKVFSMSSNAWLELQWYLFGAVFMLGAAWTLRCNEHIRIDIVSGRFAKRARDKLDVFGHVVFLMPFVLLHIYTSWPFFLASFRSGEVSTNAGGLIVWPAKGMVLLGFLLLFAQTISELIKRIAILRGDLVDEAETPVHEAEVQRLLEATDVSDAKAGAPGAPRPELAR
jgi:TRAP-type mannitol/chloroaromatic compound transport system permease small subunit